MSEQRNPVGWFEIYVSDMERARKFYETVFAWELESLPTPESGDSDSLEMWMFSGDPTGAGCGGALCTAASRVGTARWCIFPVRIAR